MDGLVDWYWLGVVIGLGVGVGVIGREARRPLLGFVALVLTAGAVAISLLALQWWAILSFVGAALVSWFAFRRLSSAARLLAALIVAGIALVPVLGYVLAAVVPFAGARLGRRADARYAGLRVLAKD
jgi:hypothetical protein